MVSLLYNSYNCKKQGNRDLETHILWGEKNSSITPFPFSTCLRANFVNGEAPLPNYQTNLVTDYDKTFC